MVETGELKAVLCIMVIIVGLSAVMPAIVQAVDSDATQRATETQSEGEQVSLTGSLFGVVENVDTSGTPVANVTLRNSNTGSEVTTGQIQEGQNDTVMLDGMQATIGVIEIVDDNTAVISYEYPLGLGLPDGASVILGNVTLLIMLIVVVIIVSIMLGIITGMFE